WLGAWPWPGAGPTFNATLLPADTRALARKEPCREHLIVAERGPSIIKFSGTRKYCFTMALISLSAGPDIPAHIRASSCVRGSEVPGCRPVVQRISPHRRWRTDNSDRSLLAAKPTLPDWQGRLGWFLTVRRRQRVVAAGMIIGMRP